MLPVIQRIMTTRRAFAEEKSQRKKQKKRECVQPQKVTQDKRDQKRQNNRKQKRARQFHNFSSRAVRSQAADRIPRR